MLDTLLKNGLLHDGSGRPPVNGDIAIKDGRIVDIGALNGAQAVRTLDLDGLAVSPGFIDLHTHSDFTLAADGRAQSRVQQDVTTEVIGLCGFSCAPVSSAKEVAIMAPGFTEGMVDVDWHGFDEYLDHLDKMTLGVNVAAFVGHGTIHRAVLGDAMRPADDHEINMMKALLDESIDGGAYGFSSGLEYWPGSLASPDQMAELVAVAAKRGVLYATHGRNRDLFYDIGFGEAISTARAAGARLQIAHIQPKYGARTYAMQHAIDMVNGAKAHGVDVAYDVIPHDWSRTRISAILPQWAQEGGVADVQARLRDPAMRKRIKANRKPMWRLVSDGIWHKIVLMQSTANPDLVGLQFDEIGARRGVDPYDAALDLMIEEGEHVSHLMWTSQSFSDDDIRLAIAQPDCAIISDTLALAPEGCLKHHIGSLSGYGWAARFLQHHVRDHKVLALAEGIRRLTALPATRLGITDRGTLARGAWADITVFDADQVASHCDVGEPRRFATGIANVLDNGVFSMLDGARTATYAGRVLSSH